MVVAAEGVSFGKTLISVDGGVVVSPLFSINRSIGLFLFLLSRRLASKYELALFVDWVADELGEVLIEWSVSRPFPRALLPCFLILRLYVILKLCWRDDWRGSTFWGGLSAHNGPCYFRY